MAAAGTTRIAGDFGVVTEAAAGVPLPRATGGLGNDVLEGGDGTDTLRGGGAARTC